MYIYYILYIYLSINFLIILFFLLQIVGIQQYLVKPTEVDQNENILSDQVTSDIGITEKMVKTSGIPLQDAINKVSF